MVCTHEVFLIHYIHWYLTPIKPAKVYDVKDLNDDAKLDALENGKFVLHEGDPLYLGLRWYTDPFGHLDQIWLHALALNIANFSVLFC